MNSNTYLSKDHIGRTHCECDYDPDFTVILTNAQTGKTIQIIDKDGTIRNFPGIEPCDSLSAELNIDRIQPVVFYSTTFEKCNDGRYLMVWTVRPDGRFWMDSWGFGAEDYQWVDLYSYIDESGRFAAPFRLYSIGYNKFFNGHEETKK